MHASGDRTRAINFKDGGKDHEIRDRPAFSPRHESAMRHFPTPPACSRGNLSGQEFVSRFSANIIAPPSSDSGQSEGNTLLHRGYCKICWIGLVLLFFARG